MTQVQLKMADLYDRLAAIGFPKKFVQEKVLPDWWTEEADQDSEAVLAGAMMLANRLNVNVRSLLEGSGAVTFAATCQPRFKLKNGTEAQRLLVPTALASRVAELVAYGCKQPYLGLNGWTIERIREQILASRDAVDLEGFLTFCWSIGIPVVHFSAFPPGVPKFDGMVAYYGDRPVILLSVRHKHTAKLLFIAAHELGHILEGHVTPEKPLVDQQVEIAMTEDTDEDDANQVAQALLIGRSGLSYHIWSRFLSGEQLAEKSKFFAERDRVDPGVVTMNITWARAESTEIEEEKKIIWGVSTKALSILEPNAEAYCTINNKLLQQIDWGRFDDDMKHYIQSMLNLN